MTATVNRAVSVGLLLGVDLGGTKIRAGLADQFGNLLAEREEPTQSAGGGLGAQISHLAEELRGACEIDNVGFDAIAVGGAGVALSDGSLGLAPNLSELAGVDVVGELSRALGAPVILDNDVNLAALGEVHAGTAGDTFCFVSFGTGVGMGIVVEGELLTGARGAAGEIGYLPVGADPWDPSHQVNGAFEEVVAGQSVSARYARETGRAATVPEIFDAAASGDSSACRVIDDFARWAAVGLASVIAVLDPPRIILGGGIGRRPELAPRICDQLTLLGHGDVAVAPSSLGPTGPVLGAIRRAQQHVVQKGQRP
ncbi:ROK family protein [Demequina globuliformis]|uniref:ROK family protein n=1 Tax=Demequina globuliformis TaxID=676202 RepID=UPI000783E54A|nr:ROK family protein [Demequina globuliformis]